MSMYLDIFQLYLYPKIEKSEKKNWPLCRVHKPKHSAKWPLQDCQKRNFAEWLTPGTQQRLESLPSARDLALGKAATWGSSRRWLCRVPGPGTRQSFELSRVSAVRHSAKQPPTTAPRGSFAECSKRGTRQSLLCH